MTFTFYCAANLLHKIKRTCFVQAMVANASRFSSVTLASSVKIQGRKQNYHFWWFPACVFFTTRAVFSVFFIT